MPTLMPEDLEKATSREVQLAMRKDLRGVAKTNNGKTVWFVAAGDLMLSDKKKVPLFIAVKLEAQAKAWHAALKAKKPTGLLLGTCTLALTDGKSVRIALEKVKGERKTALKIGKLAFKLDPAVHVSDALKPDDQAEAEAGSTRWADGLGVSADAAVRQLADALGVSEAEISRELNANASDVRRELESFEREMEQEIGA